MNPKTIIKIINYLVYAIIIIVPLIFFKSGMYPFQVIKTVVFQSLAEIVFALWLVLILVHREYRPKLTPLLAAIGIFMVIMTASSLMSVDRQISFWSSEARTMGLVALWHFFALFLVLASLKNEIDWEKIFLLSFGTASVVSLIALVQRLGWFPADSILYLKSAPDMRVHGTFGNSSFMAGYLLFNFFIGLWLFRQAVNRKARIALGAGAAIMGIAIFLSQTLGTIAGLTAGIFILLIYFSLFSKNKSFRIAALLAAIFCVVFASTLWFTRQSVRWQKIPGIARLSIISLKSPSVRDRLITWEIAGKAFLKKPVLGWGFENFRIAFNKNYNPKILTGNVGGTYWDKPHNVLLEYLSTTGILGLLSYVSIWFIAIYSLFKKTQINTDEKQGQLFLATGLIAGFVQNLFLFDTIGTYLMFFLILAFIDSNYGVTKWKLSSNLSAEIHPAPKQPNYYLITTLLLLVITLIPIYYNIQIFNASRDEYRGVNYFLNILPESSLVFFDMAVEANSPYKDDIIKTFAGTVKQAEQQGVSYPNIAQLQMKLVDYLNGAIDRHPQEFFNYLTMAEFLNVFYKYNPSYLDDAQRRGEEALALSPQRQQVYYALAKTQLLKGNVRGAYEIFKKVLELNPEAADPHFFFGILAYGVGDPKTGALEIARAEELGRFPSKPEEAIALGNFVGDYDGNYKKAIEYYKIAMNLVEQDFIGRSRNQLRQSILLKFGVAYYFDGDLEQSKKSFLEFQKTADFKTLPIYPDLKPVLIELGIEK